MSKPKSCTHWGHTGRKTGELNPIVKTKKGRVIGLSKLLNNTIPNQTKSDVKYARIHLPEKEYQRRMRLYRLRAALRLNLTDNSTKPQKEDEKIQCAGCGTIPEKKTYTQRLGWIRESLYKTEGLMVTLLWCPTCQQMK